MSTYTYIVLTIALCLLSTPLLAESADTLVRDTTQTQQQPVKRSFFVVPTMGFSPETSFAIGVAGGYYFPFTDPARISSVSYSASYTFYNQFTFNVSPKLYIGPNKRFYIFGAIGAQHYPDYYYGIGNSAETILPSAVPYTSDHYYINIQPQYFISKNWSVGGSLAIRQEKVTSGEGMEEAHQLEPALGFDPYFMLGIGAVIAYDTRNNLFYPTQGMFFKTVVNYYEPYLGSSYRGAKTSLDFRYFSPVYKEFILAWQFISEASLGRNMPFQMMPTLGGRDVLRGFRQGNFRDDLAVALQAELRVPIWWRFKAALFCSIGDVYDIHNPTLSTPKIGYGAGLRFRLNKANVHLRVDLARQNYLDKWSFYITASESF